MRVRRGRRWVWVRGRAGGEGGQCVRRRCRGWLRPLLGGDRCQPPPPRVVCAAHRSGRHLVEGPMMASGGKRWSEVSSIMSEISSSVYVKDQKQRVPVGGMKSIRCNSACALSRSIDACSRTTASRVGRTRTNSSSWLRRRGKRRPPANPPPMPRGPPSTAPSAALSTPAGLAGPLLPRLPPLSCVAAVAAVASRPGVAGAGGSATSSTSMRSRSTARKGSAHAKRERAG